MTGNICIDCKKNICLRAIRCSKCHIINMWKNPIVKKKCSDAGKKRFSSLEERNKVSKRFTGYKHTEESNILRSKTLKDLYTSGKATCGHKIGTPSMCGMRGKKHSIETKKKMSLHMLGNKNPMKNPETAKKVSNYNKINSLGINNPNYKGGLSSHPYTLEFVNKRSYIIKKYNYTCQQCGFNKNDKRKWNDVKFITVHHIDYDKNNNLDNNLICLCNVCNSLANSNRDYWKEFYNKKVI